MNEASGMARHIKERGIESAREAFAEAIDEHGAARMGPVDVQWYWMADGSVMLSLPDGSWSDAIL